MSDDNTKKIFEDSDAEGIQVIHDENEDPFYVKLEGDKIKIMSGLGHDISIGIVGAMELAEVITILAEEALEIEDAADEDDDFDATPYSDELEDLYDDDLEDEEDWEYEEDD